MFKILGSIFRRMRKRLNQYTQEISRGIDTGNNDIIIENILGLVMYLGIRFALWGLGSLIFSRMGLKSLYMEASLLSFVIGIAMSFTSELDQAEENDGKTEDTSETPVSDIERKLIEEHCREIYSTVRQFMLTAILGVIGITPLARPRDEYEIETAVTGDHFYLDGRIPVFQFEVALEGPIDQVQEDIIQRELQHSAAKHISRYPMLISPDAGGRVPIEIMDVKNLGSRVCIDVIFTTKDSVAKIDARRRARVERQYRQKQIDYIDERYGE